jgi:hypothetical protein
MKPIISSVFVSAGFALLMIGAAQGVEEWPCVGPGSLNGAVLNSTTIVTPSSSSYACGSQISRFVPPRAAISVQFKSPTAHINIGDTVKLKGRLFLVSDPQRHLDGWLLKEAEIVQ